MKLEDQVAPLEASERLKELGIKQDSLFYHTHSDWGVMPKTSIDFSGNPTSAFTVAELGVMLPNAFNTMQVTSDDGRNNVWRGYDDEEKDCPLDKEYATEADARAAMLIHLLENKLITPEKVNARL